MLDLFVFQYAARLKIHFCTLLWVFVSQQLYTTIYYYKVIYLVLSVIFIVISVISSCSCEALDQAVEIEHEIFKASKSANLYKAAVLKRVSANDASLHRKLI